MTRPGRSFAALSLALAAAAPSVAGPVAGGFEEVGDGTRLTVVALDDTTLRVRLSDASGAMPEDASWAVPADVRARRANVRPVPNGFATSALSVTVDPATLRLTVRDRAGGIIVDDLPGTNRRVGTAFALRKAMPAGTRILGMGDKTGGLDRAGQTFVNWNTDSYGFGPATDPIYKSIPFYIAVGKSGAYGLFLDNTFRSSFDFGHVEDGAIAISAPDGPVDYYVTTGQSIGDIVRAQARLTGKAPLPPRWALGYQQSRYSYMSSTEVRALVDRFAAERFPLDVVWLDIDFQDRNRPFTVNRTTFPDFEQMIGDLKQRGVRTVPIVDLHIAAAPNQGYAPYDSGTAGDHWIKRADGSTYVAPVWAGPSVFPDFTRAATRDWWGGLFGSLTKAGVGGIWNDMNEPAIFETPTKTMPLDNIHRIDGSGFKPRTASHAEIHNVLGMENSRATYEGLLKLRPNQRPFVMTRASYAGGQRYAVTWTGDNNASFEHLKLAIAQQLNLGLSGFTWSGADVGGFTGGPSADLMTLWYQYATFNPIFRNHSGSGAPRAEPWVDGPDHLAIRKRYVEERYRLMPYFYAVAAEAARTGDAWMRPLGYDDPATSVACDPSMSFTIGAALLISGNPKPEGKRPFTACLPKGSGWFDYWTGRPVDGGKPVELTPTLGELPVFVRAGTIMPRQSAVLNSDSTPVGPLELHVYPGPGCRGLLFDDDGQSIRGPSRRQEVTCSTLDDGAVYVTFAKPEGRFRPWWRKIRIMVHGAGGPMSTTIDMPARPTKVRVTR